jgi:hypothetical protein
MNALFMNKYGKIFDPTGYGEFDLKCGVIRCINPEYSINQDPVRILRAIRFTVQYGFTIEKQLEAIMYETLPLLLGDITYQWSIMTYILYVCDINKSRALEMFKKFKNKVKGGIHDIT